MIKCEVEYNIVEQTLDIYMFNKDNFFQYENGEVRIIPRCHTDVTRDVRFLKIPYEFCEEFEKSIARKYANRKDLDLSIYENAAKDSHIKDLKWILTHFINKDKK